MKNVPQNHTSSTIKKATKAPIALAESSDISEIKSWDTDFETLFTIKPSLYSVDPAGNYHLFKKKITEHFTKIAENNPGFEPKIRFNDASLSVESGYTYLNFYDMLPPMEKNAMPWKFAHTRNSTRDSIQTINDLFVLQEKGKPFEVSKSSSEIKNVLRSSHDENKIIGYDRGHPFFKKALEESQKYRFPKDPIELPDGLKREDLFKELMDQNSHGPLRVVLGENHTNSTAGELLVKAMPLLEAKEAIVFLEGPFYEQQQSVFDDWIFKSPKDAPMPVEFTVGPMGGLRPIFEAAKDYGIRLVGIDTDAINAPSTQRAENMNYIAQKIINDAAGNRSFVALMGAAHAADIVDHETGKTVLGLGSILENTRSVIVLEVPSHREVLTGESVDSISRLDHSPILNFAADVVVKAHPTPQKSYYYDLHDKSIIYPAVPKEESPPHSVDRFEKFEHENQTRIDQAKTEYLMEQHQKKQANDGFLAVESETSSNASADGDSTSSGLKVDRFEKFEHENQARIDQAKIEYLIEQQQKKYADDEGVVAVKSETRSNASTAGDSTSAGLNIVKNVGISTGMLGLGAAGTVHSFQSGDILNGALGAAETATGAAGLGISAVSATNIVQKSAIGLKIAGVASKAIPVAGAVFSVASMAQDAKDIINSAQSGDAVGIVKGSINFVLDGATAVADLVPGVGTVATLGLAGTRMVSDSIIDQAIDHKAYEKTFEVLHNPESLWFEKATAAVLGSAQKAWSYTPIGQAASLISEMEEMNKTLEGIEDFSSDKQLSEMDSFFNFFLDGKNVVNDNTAITNPTKTHVNTSDSLPAAANDLGIMAPLPHEAYGMGF